MNIQTTSYKLIPVSSTEIEDLIELCIEIIEYLMD